MVVEMDDSEQTRAILAAFTPKVRDCREALGAQAVGNALYGLQCMGDSEQTRELVAALTPKVQQCRDELRKHRVDQALSQLSHFGDSDEVRDLLLVFLDKGFERAFESRLRP